MPRGFYNVRKLDFATRDWPGCRWVHRWISRRSLLLTTAWESWDEARDWLGSADFRRADLAIRGIDGTVVRIERYDHGVQIAVDEAAHEVEGPDA